MKISIKRLFIICICIFLIRPYYVQINPTMNKIWAGMTCVLSAFLMFKVFKYKKLSRGKWLIAWLFVMLLATIKNQYYNIGGVISTFFQVVLAYNIGILFGIKKYRQTVEDILGKVIYIYILMDLFFGVSEFSVKILGLKPEQTFLGYDNYAAYIILPMIAIKWAISILKKGKLDKSDWICWGGEFIYKAVYMSFNAIVGLVLFLIIYIASRYHKKFKKFLKPQYAIIVVILLLFGIIKLHIHELFSGLFVAVGKGTTLGFRTVIWGKLVPKLGSIPIIGYGAVDSGFFQDTIGLSSIWDVEANHAHNFILEIWFTTGIFGVILYIIFLWRNLKRASHLNMSYGLILLNGIVVYFLMGFIDGYPGITTFYTLLAMTYVLEKEKEL